MSNLSYVIIYFCLTLSRNILCSSNNTDDIAPTFGNTCPKRWFTYTIEKCKTTYIFNYTKPIADDNIYQNLTLQNYIPEQNMTFSNGTFYQFNLSAGVYTFRYRAQDQSKNFANCIFTVVILERMRCSQEPLPESELQYNKTCGEIYGSVININLDGKSIKYECVDGDWLKIFSSSIKKQQTGTSAEEIYPTFGKTCPFRAVTLSINECGETAMFNFSKPTATCMNKIVELEEILPDNLSGDPPYLLRRGIHRFRYRTKHSFYRKRIECKFYVVVFQGAGCPKELPLLPKNSEENKTCGEQFGSVATIFCKEEDKIIMKYKCEEGEWKKTFGISSKKCPLETKSDNINPFFGETCNQPPFQVQYVNECSNNFSFTFIEPTAKDNSNSVSITPMLPKSLKGKPPFNLLPQKTYRFRYRAIDKAGNTDNCIFDVFVLKRPSCRKELPSSEDDQSECVSRTCGEDSGSEATVCCSDETHLFKYKCVDGEWTKVKECRKSCSDNSSGEAYKLNVLPDDIPPSFGNTCPPPTMVYYTDSCMEKFEINFENVQATDNSNNVSTKLILPDHLIEETPPYMLPKGVYTFRYIAEDGSGNVADCTFEILIFEKIKCQKNLYPFPQSCTDSCYSDHRKQNLKCYNVNGSKNQVYECSNGEWKNIESSAQSNELSTADIVGITIAAVIVGGICAIGIAKIKQKRKQSNNQETFENPLQFDLSSISSSTIA